MGTSGHCKSCLRISISKRRHRSRMACSNISESMKRSPMMETLRGMRCLLTIGHHCAPYWLHFFAGFLIELECIVVGNRETGVRCGAVTEQGIDPLGRTCCHVGIKFLLHCG